MDIIIEVHGNALKNVNQTRTLKLECVNMVKRKKESYGSCRITGTNPSWDKISPTTPILNIVVPFQEALKLKLALEACLLALNASDKRTTEGKKDAVNIAINPEYKIISIDER